MKLIAARVTDFKSILDSNKFSIGDLTCLVGKNESGKTAILESIEKINSVQPSRAHLVASDHYPRLNLSEYEESGETAMPVWTEWQLSQSEVDEINTMAGATVLKSDRVTVTKNYDNALAWGTNLDYSAAVKALVDSCTLQAADLTQLGTPTTPSELSSALQKALAAVAAGSELSPGLQELNAAFAARYPNGSLKSSVELLLRQYLPKFVYYSHYDRLPGKVALDQLLAEKAAGTLDDNPGMKVFVALLSMVGTTPEAIRDITNFESLVASLEGVENRLSKKIFTYWTQNASLAVRFMFGDALPGDPVLYNSGKIFRTRIRNNRHQVTIDLDERSAGFIWFFSFLVWFSEITKQHGDNLIVLLDEPGLSLHGRAQADLLRFIKEELLIKYQVIYSTHSPFMIDPSDLLTCRTVEDVTGPNDEVLGTKVGDNVLSTDSDTLFPLQAALGYEITQSLFVGEHTLLVEGPSDLLYLQWFSDQLRKAKRTSLDSRWTITPVGGITKVASFLSLFGGNRLHVAVFTDYATGDKRKVDELRQSELLRTGHVFTAEMFVDGQAEADTEDIIGRELYVALVNATYQLTGKKALPKQRPESAPVRVVKEVEDHFKVLTPTDPLFDHFAPSRHLFEMTDITSLPALDAALDRFESLFDALNQLLA